MPTANSIQRPWHRSATKQTDTFYLSKEWRSIRRDKLEDQPLCEYHLQSGKVRAAKIVDHFLPRRFYPELELTIINLRSCCDECHQKKRSVEKKASNRFQVQVLIKEAGYE